MDYLYITVTVPGLVCLYAFFVRPILRGMPTFKEFYSEADTFWGRVWAVCGKSVTMAWSYFLMFAGALLNNLDGLATQLGDPNFKQQVADFLHGDPKYLGYFAMVVSAVTIASRLRSLTKA